MTDWFYENFEDPAHHYPYDSEEGDYHYVWGPFDAREQLEANFPEATIEEIDYVVHFVQGSGIFNWAPHQSRIRPDDIDDDRPRAPSIEQQVAALGGQLDEIERLVDTLRPQNPRMGHNRPPEAMVIAIDRQELDEVKESIRDIRGELAKQDPVNNADAATLEKAEGRFRSLARKVLGWLAKAAAAGVGILATGALGEAGKELVQDPHALATKLGVAADTLRDWIHHLHPPF
ncbi:hypothetical protein DYH55_02270 [Methylovirgula sp. 4M-Z18]|nr:hypothetical protein DYH55_02270 [Methylovirgula sp. 4M-Z18]